MKNVSIQESSYSVGDGLAVTHSIKGDVSLIVSFNMLNGYNSLTLLDYELDIHSKYEFKATKPCSISRTRAFNVSTEVMKFDFEFAGTKIEGNVNFATEMDVIGDVSKVTQPLSTGRTFHSFTGHKSYITPFGIEDNNPKSIRLYHDIIEEGHAVVDVDSDLFYGLEANLNIAEFQYTARVGEKANYRFSTEESSECSMYGGLNKNTLVTFKSIVDVNDHGTNDSPNHPYLYKGRHYGEPCYIFEDDAASRCYRSYEYEGSGGVKTLDVDASLLYSLIPAEIHYEEGCDESHSALQFPIVSMHAYSFIYASNKAYFKGAEHMFTSKDTNWITVIAKIPEDGVLVFNRASRQGEDYLLFGYDKALQYPGYSGYGFGWFVGPDESPFCRDYSTETNQEYNFEDIIPVGCLHGPGYFSISGPNGISMKTYSESDCIACLYNQFNQNAMAASVYRNGEYRNGLVVVTEKMLDECQRFFTYYLSMKFGNDKLIKEISQPGTYQILSGTIETKKATENTWTVLNFPSRSSVFGAGKNGTLPLLNSGSRRSLIQQTDENIEETRYFFKISQKNIEYVETLNTKLKVVFETKYGVDGLVNISMRIDDTLIPFSYYKFMTRREEFLEALGVKHDEAFDIRKCYMDEWGNMMVHPSLLKDKKFTNYPEVEKLIDAEGSLQNDAFVDDVISGITGMSAPEFTVALVIMIVLIVLLVIPIGWCFCCGPCRCVKNIFKKLCCKGKDNEEEEEKAEDLNAIKL